MFTHRLSEVYAKFIEIKTLSGATISLSEGHYIHVDGSVVPAAQVKIGSEVRLGSGHTDKVRSVRTVGGKGLYNPQTLQGDIVVNGILASTYTTAMDPRLAHAALFPFRSMFSALNFEVSALESGGGVASALLDYIPLWL
jgi:Hint module